MKPFFKVPAALASFALLAALAGCGAGGSIVVAPPTPPTPPDPGPPVTTSLCKSTVTRPTGTAPTSSYAGATFTGKVLAGTTPLIGASVQLYAAGATGNGSTATALGSPITTDANGAFSVTTSYTCPYNLSLLYLVARGGKTTSAGTSNSGSVLMTTLGTCNSISSNPSFVINEATTVASVYTLSQFLTAGGNVGASATNFNGLKLAAASAANLVNINTGIAPGPNFPATGTAPTLILNALANALHACVVSSTACTQLYSATSVSVTNTLDALLYVSRHPATNVAAISTLSATSTAFAPAIVDPPSDWTMYATYSGGGMNGPSGLGIDSAGNVRVANYFYAASFFSNTGIPTFAAGISGNNFYNSYGLAVDQNDNVWIPNEQSGYGINLGLGTITVLNSSGTSIPATGTTGFYTGGLNFPVSIAIDTNGTSWIVDYGNSHMTLMANDGTALSGTTGYTTNQFAFPVAVGVDSKCYGFVANQSGNTVTRVAPDGSDFTSFVTGSGASGVAVDGSDNVWVANYYGNSVGLLSYNTKILSSGYTGGGINHPQGIAIDGAGNAWVANYRGPSLSELAGASTTAPGTLLSPTAGYGPDAKLLEAFAIAIDASGNIWVTNFGNNTLTEFIGLAAPVRTPLLGPVSLP